MNANQDADYLRLLAIFHYVVAGILALFSLFPVIHLVIGIAIVSGAFPEMEQGEPLPAMMGWFFVILPLVFIIFGLAIWDRCGEGRKDCIKPYIELIDAYPQLFRSTPFMPALGNHDREIRPRGSTPPEEPVYDVDAAAFRRFFELPGEEWKWHFDVPDFGVRFMALDINHISDFGTTWQTCHAFNEDSEQFHWYQKLMEKPPPFVVTLYNERNASIRSQAKGKWHDLFRKGTLCITGFGYYAERAEVDGFPYYNTSLSGTGNKYPDPHSKFLAGEDSYILLTVEQGGKLVVEIKNLDGRVLDRQEHAQQ